jgi:hypothetical protein
MKKALTRDEALISISKSMLKLGVLEPMVIKQIRRGCYLNDVPFVFPPEELEDIPTPELRQLAREMERDCQSLRGGKVK